LAEPAIRQEVINTIRDATITYWVWVAAGQQYRIGEAALELAERRNQQIKRRVETGDLAEPSLADNRRAIIQRRGKLIDLERKLIQSAVKLSLFLRTDAAVPYTPSFEELSYFPDVIAYDESQVINDITYAVRNRPELVALDTLARRVQVDLAEAYNDTLPTLDAISNISQDVGERTSSKGDKSEFELEIGLEFEMPVQRRKGFGKMRSARAKINQIAAKRQFTVEKISTEVQNAAAALDAAYERVQAITDAVEISEKLAAIERRKFELGESDLLAVFLREQIAIEAASDLMVAKLEYFIARADYTAALAYEFPVLFPSTTE
jgi:outer membrane protein TolC